MKKLISVFLVLLMLLSYPMISYADGSEIGEYTNGYVEYYEDGSYSITAMELTALSVSTVKQSKTTTYYSSKNEKEWAITVTGNFNFTGSSATCTNSTVSYTIYDNNWKVTSSQASKSGRTATGEFTLKRYFLGVPIKTDNETLTITCSNTGVCS